MVKDLALIKAHLDDLPTLDKPALVLIKARCIDAKNSTKSDTNRALLQVAIDKCNQGLFASM